MNRKLSEKVTNGKICNRLPTGCWKIIDKNRPRITIESSETEKRRERDLLGVR